MNRKTLYIAQAAMIAALYVVLTFLANMFGLANYAIQVRFSEALTILPLFTPAAVPGLFIGCIISNLLTGCMPLDVIFGSLATLAGAFGTLLLKKAAVRTVENVKKERPWIAALPPIAANTIVVPLVLRYVYELPGSIPYFMLTVGAGEVISAGVLGCILYYALRPHASRIFIQQPADK